MKVKTLILGGGIAGIAAAYHLDKDHLVLEKSEQPGGLAGSFSRAGFTFDHTGHLLHLRNPYTLKLIPELLRDNIALHQRSAWIYSHDRFTRYPFQAHTYGLPKRVISDCVNGFKQAVKCKGKKPKNFKEWVLRTFGAGFGKHFFFPYNEKLWTVPAEQMTTEWMGQFVPTPPLDEVLQGATGENDKTYGYNAEFYYPKTGGIRSLIMAFLDTGRVRIRCGAEVVDINTKEKCVRTQTGATIFYKHLINTLPLPFFVQLLHEAPTDISQAASMLKFTSVYNLNLGIRGPNLGEGKHWIYYPERKYIFYRVGFPHAFTNAATPKNCSSMYVEIACNRSKGQIDTAALRRRCINDLDEAGLLTNFDSVITEVPVMIPVAYVIYDKNRTPCVNKIMGYLLSMGIQSFGRFGAWEYSFMEKCILQGKEAAEKIK